MTPGTLVWHVIQCILSYLCTEFVYMYDGQEYIRRFFKEIMHFNFNTKMATP